MRLPAGAASARPCPAEWPRRGELPAGGARLRAGRGVSGALQVLLTLRGRSAWGLWRATGHRSRKLAWERRLLRGGVA